MTYSLVRVYLRDILISHGYHQFHATSILSGCSSWARFVVIAALCVDFPSLLLAKGAPQCGHNPAEPEADTNHTPPTSTTQATHRGPQPSDVNPAFSCFCFPSLVPLFLRLPSRFDSQKLPQHPISFLLEPSAARRPLVRIGSCPSSSSVLSLHPGQRPASPSRT
ncbi:hypothetical protein B0J18DRAFT_137503 [Chaetomium sp. MPI-SDFR-AT-0129]|nr:hypothetical protein B0J18DRAFT_137503 [Chaetomium sp. MPI-SDFR-AT-0129]